MRAPFAARLYRLQQRLALTTPEASALLTLSAILVVGLGLREWQERAAPPPPALFGAVPAGLDAAAPALALAAPMAPLPTLDEATASGAAPAVGHAEGEHAADVTAEDEAPARSSRRSSPSPGPVNVNTAGAAELDRLPGVGPAIAQRILEHRRAHGPFRRAEDVLAVKGIGPKKLASMRPYLRF